MEFIERFTAARMAGTPLITITTPDQAATVQQLCRRYAKLNGNQPPILHWDIARGLSPLNETGGTSLDRFMTAANGAWESPEEATNLVEVLRLAGNNGSLDPKTIFFVANLQLYLEASGLTQAIYNLREAWKPDLKTLVGLAPNISLPPEIEADFINIDEPLPTNEQLTTIVEDCFKAADSALGIGEVSKKVIERCVDACCGMPAFTTETITSMSINKKLKPPVDFENLWLRKRAMIEAMPGLSTDDSGMKFKDLAGLDNLTSYLTKVAKGRKPFRLIVILDEGEKLFAGATGGTQDSSGSSQAILGAFLTEMQDRGYPGLIAFGPPGAGKSAAGKAAAGEFDIPAIVWNVGETKSKWVGESEANIGRIFKMLYAISGGELLFYMTVNRIEGLRPEFRRRFKLGTFFVDLPTAEGRPAIWDIYIRKFGLDPDFPKPNDDGWTGAEIEQCCSLAWQLNIPPVEASTFIVPIATAIKEEIETVRRQASNRYISANQPGVYTFKPNASGIEAGKRAMSKEVV